MEILQIPIQEIYEDPVFNCRGQPLNKGDVLDLIDSIKRTRLEVPIVVQPLDECVIITPPPPGIKYRVLNGNRRFVACRILYKEDPVKYPMIPSIVRYGLSDDDARALNLADNLERKDLTLTQEAFALKKWKDAGYPRETVGRMIGQSGSWVQIRFNLLDLPKDIHDFASRGLIGQDDVKDLYQYRNDMDELFKRTKEIITYRLRGKKPPKIRNKRQQARARRLGRSRSNVEIVEMMDHISDNLGAGFITRCMAWCAGNVTTIELLPEIKTHAETLGKPYIPLDEDKLEHL